jgi:putative tricarboxylic transport membrane protein
LRTTLTRLERGICLALFALSVFVVWQSARMPGGTLSLPGPGMLPLAIGVLLGLSSLALILRSLRPGPDHAEAVVVGNRRIAAAFLALILAGLAFERIGFLATGTLFLFVLLRMLSPLGWLGSLVAGFVAALIMNLAFLHGLGVSLPAYPWSF